MIYDGKGRPVEPSLKELAQAVGNDIQQMGRMISILQRNITLVEMKANFLVTELQSLGILKEDLNDKWAEFVKAEAEKMKAAQEEEELTTVSDDFEVAPIDVEEERLVEL